MPADAFAKGDILQVLLFSMLFGVALAALKEKGTFILRVVDDLSKVLFRIVGIVMRVAPIGAFGAMAFTVGKYGIGTLLSLGKLMGTFYATSLLFVILVLAGYCSMHRGDLDVRRREGRGSAVRVRRRQSVR